MSPTAEAEPGPPWLGMALAFTAGFADTVGFIALSGLFVAHVTGNLVLLGAALAGGAPGAGQGVVSKLLVLPVFMIAIAGTRVLVATLGRRGAQAARPVLLLEAALLACFATMGVALGPFASADAPAALVTAGFGVLAMGVQNAAARLVFGSMAPTTVMTGNVTQLVLDGAELATRREAVTAGGTEHSRIARLLPLVLGFAAGAAMGGLGYWAVGFWCLVLPALALAVAALQMPQPAGMAEAPR